jgi:phage terminase large subunit GpA-like protein
MAIKGDSTLNKEIVTTPKKVDIKNDTKAAKFGLKVWMVGTNKAKDLFSSRLKHTGHGPGRIHFYNNVRADYYEQITSEVKAPHRTMKGKLTWQKKSGVRNEGLDCEVYALHAARVKRIHLKKPADWDSIEGDLAQGDLLSAAVATVSVEPEAPVKKNPSVKQTKPAANGGMAALARRLGGGN